MIQIVPYTEAWPLAFESEAAALRRVMGAQAIRIEHVGSTAVPGLAAKPVIDIQVSVQSLESLEPFKASLATLGYQFVSITILMIMSTLGLPSLGNGQALIMFTSACRVKNKNFGTSRSATTCARTQSRHGGTRP